MNDAMTELYREARVGRIGADRMALGLPCIPHRTEGDLEYVQQLYVLLKQKVSEIAQLTRERDEARKAAVTYRDAWLTAAPRSTWVPVLDWLEEMKGEE